MTRVRITTPVPDHTGIVGNVWIADGVGFADTETHAAEIAYCRRNGYTVTELGEPLADAEPEAVDGQDDLEAEGPEDDPLPRRNGSAEAWRAYAIAHGMTADEAESLNRDQLVERLTSTEETTS